MFLAFPRTSATFSTFRLNTSKSANIKVVRLFEGHNFIIGGIGDFEWKTFKKVVNASIYSLTEPRKIGPLPAFYAQTRDQNTSQPLQEVCSYSSSTNFILGDFELIFGFLLFGSSKRAKRYWGRQRRAPARQSAPTRAAVWRPGCLGVRVPHDGRAS
jgi:hypothetical protein